MAQKFLTDIELTRGLKDSSGDLGSSGQVLSSTGTGLNWINSDQAAAAAVVYQDGFTGNGTTTAFTLANSIDNENKTQVYLDGVYQHKDTYSLSGTTLTFSTAPPNLSDIEVISFSSVSSADDILYDDDFTSAGLMTTNGSGSYSITTNNSSNWNTAYTYSQVGHLPLAGGTLTGNVSLISSSTVNLRVTDGTQNIYVGSSGNTRFGLSSGASIIQSTGASFGIGTQDGNNFVLGANNTAVLTLDTSANATFAGEVTAVKYDVSNTSGYLVREDTGSGYGLFKSSTTNIGIASNGNVALNFDISSNATFAGNVNIADSKKINIGSGNDLQIFHTGSVTTFDNFTGNLQFVQAADNADIIFQNDDGSGGLAEYFRIDGGSERNIASKELQLLDNVYLTFGSGRDLRLIHDGSNNFLESYNHHLFIDQHLDNGDITFRSDNGSGGLTEYFRIDGGTQTNVFSKSATFAGTIDITGDYSIDGNILIGTTATYTIIRNPEETSAIFLGDSADPSNYYDNNQHYWRASGGGTIKMALVSSTGKLGIGTTSPSAKLHLAVSSANDDTFHIFNGSVRTHLLGSESTNGVIYLRNSSNSNTVRINSSGNSYFNGGNVGIGKTPSTWKLDVDSSSLYIASFDGTNNTGVAINSNNTTAAQILGYSNSASTYNDLDIRGNGTAGSGIYIDGSESRVGIGTTNPLSPSKLQVEGGDVWINRDNAPTNIYFRLNRRAGQDGGILLYGNNALDWQIVNASGTRNLNFYSYGTSSVVATIQNSTGNVGIGTTPSHKLHIDSNGSSNSVIRIDADDNRGANRYALDIVDDDTNSRGSVRISTTSGPSLIATGNVGIGTTSPSAKLHASIANSADAFILERTGSVTGKYRFGIGGSNLLAIRDYAQGQTRMVIDGSGKVGIGTTSPDAKLHIEGSSSDQKVLEISTGQSDGPYTAYKNRSSGTTTLGFIGNSQGIMNSGTTNFGMRANNDLTFSSGGATERMRITSGGEVIIGNTVYQNGANNIGIAPDLLRIGSNTVGASTLVSFTNANGIVGTIVATGSATAYNTSSDYRLKEDLQDFAGLDMISKIPVYDFKWKADESRSYGVIAHELEKVLPQAVIGEKDAEEMQSVDYSKIVPLLVKSIQELKKEIEILKSK